MITKPSIGFVTRDTDALLLTNTETIVTAMTNNADYPTPSPALAVVTTAANAFSVALAEAADGGREKTAIKNAKRAELVALLRQLGAYVALTCGNDLAKLLGSGFPVQKPTRTPVGVLPAPVTPVVSQGSRSGELYASSSPLNGAYTYNWRAALASAPTVHVQTAQTTGARHTFSGLTPGQLYIVDVNAVGSAGASNWSNAAELMVI